MGAILRFAFFVLLLLVSANLAAEAQFLGQQSLSESSYVIDQSGNLWAWGRNLYGQLGVGDRTDHNTPLMVPVPPGASKWVLVAGGANFAVAVADSDKLYAWGLNDKGQIGTGIAGGLYVAPVRIQNPPYVTTWKWVSAGADHCEALTTDGRLFAWGNNAQGQLGVGNTDYLITPQPVEFPTGVTSWADVAAGPGYTMMIAQNGLLYGCGVDSLSTFQPLEGPQLAMTDTFRAYSPLPCIAASYRLESRIDRELFADYAFYIAPTGGSPETMAAVADGAYHAVFLTMTGSIVTAGDNTYGQLGIGPGASLLTGTVRLPAGVTQFVAIAAGLRHSLAIGNDGWLYAWGDDSVGELGIGAAPNQSKPVKVLRVCLPLAMSGSFAAPDSFVTPFSVTLTVKNTSMGSLLTNADAFMLIGAPLYLDSVPDEMMPSPISPNATSSVEWDGSVTPPNFANVFGLEPIYFAYVRAAGSAPLLCYGMANVIAKPWKICDEANVVDSLTGEPLSGADLVYPGPPPPAQFPGMLFDSNKMVSDGNGIFSLCFLGPIYDPYPQAVTIYPFNIMKENYSTTRYAFPVPYPMQVTFRLGPSDIQGTFVAPVPPFIGDSILKVYYPDSLIGFALSRRAIFRTMDSGIHWTAMYEANVDLHDVKFLDPSHGLVVGDGGEILTTADTGETWEITHMGTRNLRALAIVGADTAWAVGDSGTMLKKSGAVWSPQPVLSAKDNLAAIHFLDPNHGVIGGNGVYYLYNEETWVRHTIGANLRAVSYVSPDQMYFAGTNGTIINYNDTLSLYDLIPGIPFIDTFITDSTYTTHTINSLYFLNVNTGYAVGDSGTSFVTYDAGISWASMTEFPHSATSVNFFSLAGHGATDNAVLNYTGVPDTFSSIVRGRLTYGNPPEPILGAKIVRYYIGRLSPNPIDTASIASPLDSIYTNEQGNFVFTGIDAVFPYDYHIDFTDSGIAKTKIFPKVKGKLHEIITLNYNDYTPPPPDTVQASVDQSSEAALSLEVSSFESYARIFYSVPSAGSTRLIMQDVLGRMVRTISNGFSAAGPQETEISLADVPAGSYYITLETGGGSITRKFVLLR